MTTSARALSQLCGCAACVLMCERRGEARVRRPCVRTCRRASLECDTLKSLPLFQMHLSSECGHTIQAHGGKMAIREYAVRHHAADPVIGCVCMCVIHTWKKIDCRERGHVCVNVTDLCYLLLIWCILSLSFSRILRQLFQYRYNGAISLMPINTHKTW